MARMTESAKSNNRSENNLNNGTETNGTNTAQETAVVNGNGKTTSETWLDLAELKTKRINELVSLAKEMGIERVYGLKKQDLILEILKSQTEQKGLIFSSGVLEILSDGYGFLRSPNYNYLPGPDDIYVSPSQIRLFGLKTGDTIAGQIRPPKDNERVFALLRIEAINFENPENLHRRVMFDDLTPLYPHQRIGLETETHEVEMRIMNLMTPIGKGQRALIV